MTPSPLRIAITPGEPAGIGPDILITLVQQPLGCELVAIADPAMLIARAKQLKLPLTVSPIDFSLPTVDHQPGQLKVLPVSLAKPARAGQLNSENSHYVIETLNQAVHHTLNKNCSALVTGPIHKGIIAKAAKESANTLHLVDSVAHFNGHTEYLASLSNALHPVMMLMTNQLKVALVTTHLPLNQVASQITTQRLTDTIQVLHTDLRDKFAITNPRIIICGLNPHAGESGQLGTEEQTIITPTVDKLRNSGMQLIGPLPADTAFTTKVLQQGDAVLAMYHDQGLPTLKHQGFGQAINVTLGLPFIRTSVDHGTALDIAGTGRADIGSLQQAVVWAIKLAHQTNQPTA